MGSLPPCRRLPGPYKPRALKFLASGASSELLEKLAALVPPPRLNLVRYHGVLAPHAADRAQIVPGPKPGGRDRRRRQ